MHSRLSIISIALTLAVSVTVGCASTTDENTVVAMNPLTGEIGEFPDGQVPDGWLECEDSDCSVVADALCPVAECGPALGMPNYPCEDGSMGGPTGRCLLLEGGRCGWEILECPDTGECTPDECGPQPGMPSYPCDDGTMGGPTGQCLRNEQTGQCGWEIRSCPAPGECSVELCGPAPGMPSWECEDGTIGGATGRCLLLENGDCGWEIRDCPPAAS